MSVPVFAAGNYRYIKAVFQYSGGVAAEPGFEIERARFARPLPLTDGYAAIEAHLKALGRPPTAFAACELRTPEQFTDQGFIDFNRVYVKTLERWGIYRDGAEPVNPVARTNVCPVHHKPREPVLYAFSYTVPARSKRPTFIISGGGEVRAKSGSYAERIVRYNETSPSAMQEKVAHVFAEMERRLGLLGFSWADAITTQAYTVQDIGALVGEMFDARGALSGGLAWIFARPPVIGLEFEMDVRGAAREIIL
jgi:hypothetical protein